MQHFRCHCHHHPERCEGNHIQYSKNDGIKGPLKYSPCQFNTHSLLLRSVVLKPGHDNVIDINVKLMLAQEA